MRKGDARTWILAGGSCLLTGCAAGDSAPVEPADAVEAAAAALEPAPFADVPIRLIRDGVALRFRPNAAPAPAEREDGRVRYRRAVGEADLVREAAAERVEDFLEFATRPAVEEVAYTIELEHTAGLRLVDETLEFLDEGGVPRLRMTPPTLVDATGTTIDATVRVEGCAYDTNAGAPWRHPVVDPGASVCTVVIGWADVAYPIVLDPAWTTTGSLTPARYDFVAIALAPDPGSYQGDVLVAGGVTVQAGKEVVLKSARLKHPQHDAWATTSDMHFRRKHAAAVQIGEDVFVLGGSCPSCPALQVVDRWQPGLGKWTKEEHSLQTAHEFARATVAKGAVVVSGGSTGVIELYRPDGDTTVDHPDHWDAQPRTEHTSSLVKDDSVLICGGLVGGIARKSCELVNVKNGELDTSVQMSVPRSGHTSTPLFNGNILVAGGDPLEDVGGTSEVFNSELRSFDGSSVRTLSMRRHHHAAAVMCSPGFGVTGRVLLMGGFTGPVGSEAATSASDSYPDIPGHLGWALNVPMNQPRANHTALPINTSNGLIACRKGKGGNNANGILVAGGELGAKTALDSVEIFGLLRDREACESATQCQHNRCVKHVCCLDDCDKCTTNSECGGDACGPSGNCELAIPFSRPEVSCETGGPTPAQPDAWLALLGIAAAVARYKRKVIVNWGNHTTKGP